MRAGRSTALIASLACLLLAAGRLPAADVFVATTAADFGTGSAAVLASDAEAAQVNLLSLHSDAGATFYEGRVYVVNRLGQDNILVLDPADWGKPVLQFSVGNGTNPQDIEFVSAAKAYVSLLETTYLLIVNPEDGTELGRIDLSTFADGDGLPEIAQMALVGSRLFVSIQRLDRDSFWAPAGDSYLAVIDTRTDELIDADPATEGVQGVKLAATNPGVILAVGNQVIVQQVGSYMALDGGVEVIDATTLTSRGLVITEEMLGGQTGAMTMVSATRGYVTSSAWPTYDVFPFDLSAGTVGEKLSGCSGGYIPALAADGGRLIVADRGTEDNLDAAGLLIFDAATGVQEAGPISTGLPPNTLAVMVEAPVVTAVTEASSAVPVHTHLGAAYPNPFNAGTQIPFQVEADGVAVRLVVRDVLGRTVRTLIDGPAPVGAHMARWNGTDAHGAVVGNGLYLVELTTGDMRQLGKVMLLK